jgi:hypothetical protein
MSNVADPIRRQFVANLQALRQAAGIWPASNCKQSASAYHLIVPDHPVI